MLLMMMHKHDPHTEAGEPPPPEIFHAMGEYVTEMLERGAFITGAGLGRSATRTRLTFRGGACTVKHGPYTGEHELPAAALMLHVKTREEAIGWAERYGKILGDGEIELGKVNEMWEFGFGEKPADAPLRILLVEKADAAYEAGTRSAKQKADLTRLRTEMTKAGVLASTTLLHPSAQAKRLVFTNHDLRLVDGPFAESKEMIGGFSIMELPSIDVAIEESKRYARILGGTLELDIRPIELSE